MLRLHPLVFTVATTFMLAACAGAAVRPRAPDLNASASLLAGRVKVLKSGSDVTEKCQVTFSDETGYNKAQLHLDESGWVFSPAAPGPTFLSYIRCDLAMSHLEYSTRRLYFEVPRQSQAVYFGHVLIELERNSRWRGSDVLDRAALHFVAGIPGLILYDILKAKGHAMPRPSNLVSVHAAPNVVAQTYRERFGQPLELRLNTAVLAELPPGQSPPAQSELPGWEVPAAAPVVGADAHAAGDVAPVEHLDAAGAQDDEAIPRGAAQ